MGEHLKTKYIYLYKQVKIKYTNENKSFCEISHANTDKENLHICYNSPLLFDNMFLSQCNLSQ